MPFVPVLLAEVQKRVAKILVADPDDGSYAVATTDQMHYAPQEITDAILETDMEVLREILSTLSNPYRVNYLANSADLNYGDTIPFHTGKIGHVDVKIGANYVPGILAPSLEAISRWAADTVLFPTVDCAGRYYITEEHKVFFIGDKIRVQVPSDIVVTGACQSPQNYTATVVRGSVSLLVKDGTDENLLQNMYAQYQRDLEMIRQGANAVPALDLFKRAVG